jgi:apolipoprotein D and lipocalin family protein
MNRCVNALDGDAPRGVRGSAYAVEGSGNARLRVSFFWPFHADYWVIGLDPDYRWAVVGEPRRRYLWILSRTPAMAPEDYARAVAVAREAGYDLSRLRMTRQRAA